MAVHLTSYVGSQGLSDPHGPWGSCAVLASDLVEAAFCKEEGENTFETENTVWCAERLREIQLF